MKYEINFIFSLINEKLLPSFEKKEEINSLFFCECVELHLIPDNLFSFLKPN